MPNEQSKNKLAPAESKELTEEKHSRMIKRVFSSHNIINLEKTRLSELNKLVNKSDDPTPEQEKRKTEIYTEMFHMYGLENGLFVASLSHDKYFPALAHIRQKIVSDYNCTTSLELMLADRIEANYWRAMRNDTLLNHYIEDEDGSFEYNQLKINAIKEFNKGIEQADRQLNANIMLLKELKQPKLNIKVEAENAYIAQNQQVVNTENKPRPIDGESLEADDLGTK